MESYNLLETFFSDLGVDPQSCVINKAKPQIELHLCTGFGLWAGLKSCV